MKAVLAVALLALLGGCATTTPEATTPQDAFFERISSMCGKNFEGRLATPVAADPDFAGKRLLARGGTCTKNEVRIAFDVGDDRSRTWIITRTPEGLRLKHRHMLKDGTEDPVSQYGGDTVAVGTAMRQKFPADAFSKAMFTARDMTVSLPNVWAFEIEPGSAMTYELARPGRLLRVTFDLSRPVAL